MSFAVALTTDTTRLRIPMIIYNTGARTQVVESLRLTVVEPEHQLLEWVTTGKELRSIPGQKDEFAAPFAVDGRRVSQLFPDFRPIPRQSWTPEPGSTYQLAVQAYILRGKRWRTLAEFPLTIPVENVEHFIVHGNEAVKPPD